MAAGVWLFILLLCLNARASEQQGGAQSYPLWEIAIQQASIHRFSTLFTAQDVRKFLSTREGLAQAASWCKHNGITKVYIETFRGNYRADKDVLLEAKALFQRERIIVSGCVTTTQVGKPSTGWKENISCYTDVPTQEKLQSIFEFTAGLFDEVMIDDFWFTDCACPDCDAARRAKTVSIGGAKYPVSGDTWEDYRCELMTRVSRDCILNPARKVNPNVKTIIKYPQWYDNFHERGYEVLRQTADFDRIWVGTETRDYDDARWGGTVQYEAFFIMRWLGGIGGGKCGGGWYDWLGTTEKTYVEQARQTVLGGARESLLFCYGGLQGDTGPGNMEAFRGAAPELLAVAKEMLKRAPTGVAAYKPANSHPENEKRVFDFAGMMGLPLAPCHLFPTNAEAAFFSMHALKDPDFESKLAQFLLAGKPVLITDGLSARLQDRSLVENSNTMVLAVQGEPKRLLTLDEPALNAIRAHLLKPLHTHFKAPNKVALYLFRDGSSVIENFNDTPAPIEFRGKKFTIAARAWAYRWR
jgi:hypothetical protein